MIIQRLAFGALATLQDVIRALRSVERASAEELVYLQDSDPGAVGAKKIWLTTAGVASVRSADNSVWIPFA